MQHKITSREKAKQLVEEFLQSSQTQKAFCKERNLNVSTFQWWLRRNKESTTIIKSTKVETPFVRLTPQKTIATTSDENSELTIDFQNGTRLKWRGFGVPPSLCQLIASLNASGDVQ